MVVLVCICSIMRLSIIVAIDQKRGIGKNNKLMWNIPEDLQRFKKITSGHTIIMGRKTFESIGRPLPNRTNIVITHNLSLIIQDAIVVSSLEDALNKAKEIEKDEVFIVGGGQIFEQAIGLTDKLYLTIVEGDFGADTFFPDYSQFKKVISEESGESEGYKYKFLELER